MVDVLSTDQRSYCMSRIRGRDTGPEKILRKALWAAGLRYRIKNKLPGKPDLVFFGKKIAVFVDGCFWHGCPKHYVKPKSNTDFWEEKIAGNVARDLRTNINLNERGWLVIRIWEHQIKQDLAGCTRSILKIVNTR